MRLQEKYKELRDTPKALLATNFYNFETLQGVLQAALRNNSPIILQLTRSSIEYMGLPLAVQMARTAIDQQGVEAWVHLDHGDSIELVAQCLDAGFDSVMIDASEKPFRETLKSPEKWLPWPVNTVPVWRLNWDMWQNWDNQRKRKVLPCRKKPAGLWMKPGWMPWLWRSGLPMVFIRGNPG